MLRLAESVSKTPLNLQEASAALYPPIPYALLIILGLCDTQLQWSSLCIQPISTTTPRS